MSPTWHPFFLPRATSKSRYLPAGSRRLLVTALVLWVVLAESLVASAAPLAPPGKKLIEYGWDVPTPVQMRDELAAMEKRPFDGLIFRLSGGHNAFVTKPLEAAMGPRVGFDSSGTTPGTGVGGGSG